MTSTTKTLIASIVDKTKRSPIEKILISDNSHLKEDKAKIISVLENCDSGKEGLDSHKTILEALNQLTFGMFDHFSAYELQLIVEYAIAVSLKNAIHN